MKAGDHCLFLYISKGRTNYLKVLEFENVPSEGQSMVLGETRRILWKADGTKWAERKWKARLLFVGSRESAEELEKDLTNEDQTIEGLNLPVIPKKKPLKKKAKNAKKGEKKKEKKEEKKEKKKGEKKGEKKEEKEEEKNEENEERKGTRQSQRMPGGKMGEHGEQLANLEAAEKNEKDAQETGSSTRLLKRPLVAVTKEKTMVAKRALADSLSVQKGGKPFEFAMDGFTVREEQYDEEEEKKEEKRKEEKEKEEKKKEEIENLETSSVFSEEKKEENVKEKKVEQKEEKKDKKKEKKKKEKKEEKEEEKKIEEKEDKKDEKNENKKKGKKEEKEEEEKEEKNEEKEERIPTRSQRLIISEKKEKGETITDTEAVKENEKNEVEEKEEKSSGPSTRHQRKRPLVSANNENAKKETAAKKRHVDEKACKMRADTQRAEIERIMSLQHDDFPKIQTKFDGGLELLVNGKVMYWFEDFRLNNAEDAIEARVRQKVHPWTWPLQGELMDFWINLSELSVPETQQEITIRRLLNRDKNDFFEKNEHLFKNAGWTIDGWIFDNVTDNLKRLDELVPPRA